MLIEKNKIYHMDCLEGMKHIPDKSIDMILCDLPYGITDCGWDKLIPFDLLWKQYKRIIKENKAIVLTASQPFTTDLINECREWFKYNWVWIKNTSTGFQNAKNMPLRKFEEILIFSNGKTSHAKLSKNRMVYNPQGLVNKNPSLRKKSKHNIYDIAARDSVWSQTNYPTNILNFDKESSKLHPTQKPVALFEYLIKTYSNENDTVLDNCMGSGTTAIACLNTNRKYIGFEPDKKYFDICNKRISDHLNQEKAA